MFAPTVAEFLKFLWLLLPGLLPRWIGAWLAALVLLLYGFRWVKPHVRPHALRVDARIRAWARGLRFQHGPESLGPESLQTEPSGPPRERVPLTWFFRFWTNFASAPALSVLAVLVPLAAFCSVPGAAMEVQPHLEHVRLWLLPAFGFFGSMPLSYVLKRVFKRLRPPIEVGAFGHKLTRDPSFPSGHSLTSCCFWIMMVLSLAVTGAPPATVLGFAVLAMTIIGLTGLSRIYMGVHFPSDVAGGYTIGLVWTVLCYLALYPVL